MAQLYLLTRTEYSSSTPLPQDLTINAIHRTEPGTNSHDDDELSFTYSDSVTIAHPTNDAHLMFRFRVLKDQYTEPSTILYVSTGKAEVETRMVEEVAVRLRLHATHRVGYELSWGYEGREEDKGDESKKVLVAIMREDDLGVATFWEVVVHFVK